MLSAVGRQGVGHSCCDGKLDVNDALAVLLASIQRVILRLCYFYGGPVE
jgi:hypothetical protein